MSKVKNFFSSPLRSALFTLFATLLIVFVVFAVIMENNRLSSFDEAVEISLKDMGYQSFAEQDEVILLKGALDCHADGSEYYIVILRAKDGFDHAYLIWARSGEIGAFSKESSEGLTLEQLPDKYDVRQYDYDFDYFR